MFFFVRIKKKSVTLLKQMERATDKRNFWGCEWFVSLCSLTG